MNFLIPSAYATNETTAAGNPLGSILFMVGFFALMYFILWRPQRQRQVAQQNLVSGLNVDDEIVTSGGLAGKISHVDDNFLQMIISDGVTVTVQKNSVISSLPKGTLKGL